jgi:hypothetical protein
VAVLAFGVAVAAGPALAGGGHKGGGSKGGHSSGTPSLFGGGSKGGHDSGRGNNVGQIIGGVLGRFVR